MGTKIQKKQAPEQTMIQYLTQSTVSDLTNNEKNIQVRQMVSEMSVGLTIQKSIDAPKIFQLKKKVGEEIIVKILVVVIHTFCNSLKVKEKMDVVEVVDCARTLADKYTHDSIKDIILALKEAKSSGKIFYNAVSEQVIYQIIDEFMNMKAAFIENKHNDTISTNDGSVRTIYTTVNREKELFENKLNAYNENKKLKEVQEEKKEVKKLADFIDKNIKKL